MFMGNLVIPAISLNIELKAEISRMVFIDIYKVITWKRVILL